MPDLSRYSGKLCYRVDSANDAFIAISRLVDDIDPFCRLSVKTGQPSWITERNWWTGIWQAIRLMGIGSLCR